MSGSVTALWEQHGGERAWLAAGARCARCFQRASPDTKSRRKQHPFHWQPIPGVPLACSGCISDSQRTEGVGCRVCNQPQSRRAGGDRESTACSGSGLWKGPKFSPPVLRRWEGSGCSGEYSHLGIFTSRSSAGKTPHCPCSEPDLFNYSESKTKWL